MSDANNLTSDVSIIESSFILTTMLFYRNGLPKRLEDTVLFVLDLVNSVQMANL